jgi:bacterioferritin-associated ferredoxin
MLVCHCKAVSDRAIRSAVRNGAQTVSDVARSCGAGDHCGGCLDVVQELIHSESAHHAQPHTLPASDSPVSTPDA